MRLIIFIALSIIICLFSDFIGNAQEMNDQVNDYARIWTIFCSEQDNPDSVIISNSHVFNVGDTVLFIQNKGAEIIYPFGKVSGPPTHWGKVSDLGNTGIYSLLFIKEKIGNTVVFNTSLPLFDEVSDGDISQLIKIRTKKKMVINENISCQPWNPFTGTGGVLVLMAQHKIIMNADVDVTGKGFIGAPPLWYNFSLNAVDSVTPDCPVVEDPYAVNIMEVISGFKGGSIVNSNFVHIKGNYNIANGGGAGNGILTGGGGGSNASWGGSGGLSSESCNLNISMPGLPGTSLEMFYRNDGKYMNRVFMGGGGGSGIVVPGVKSSSGGNGGGIIIVITDTLVSMNNNKLSADGQHVSDVVTGSGGGGGGAGSIILDVAHFIGPAHLSVAGGNGGKTNDPDNKTGPGGFGGAGLIWHSRDKLPDSVTYSLNNGNPGIHVPSGSPYGASTGNQAEGIIVKKLTTPLRGFLFNILADRQHICGNDTTTPLKSTSPKGGDGVYKFKWEISYNLAEWDTAPGKNHKEEYFPGLEIREAYFRRIVSSAEVEDTSNIVHFMRGIPVEKTSIKGDQIICDGTLPAPLTENKQELSSASDEFTYTWQYRQLGNEWTAILDSDSPHYQPGALHETTFYRRIVQSGACMDTSNVVVVGIIHLPEIQLQFLGDSLEQGQDIELTAIISGEESFSIQWMRDEEKISGAVGTSLLIPDIDSKDAGNYYFIVTNQCGSVFSDTIFIYIHETNSEHGLHSTGNIELYPNPAGNFLHVNHSFTDPYKISIFNAVGHLVMEESNNDHLSLEHIPDGIYILRIACPDQETHLTYRFVIKR